MYFGVGLFIAMGLFLKPDGVMIMLLKLVAGLLTSTNLPGVIVCKTFGVDKVTDVFGMLVLAEVADELTEEIVFVEMFGSKILLSSANIIGSSIIS